MTPEEYARSIGLIYIDPATGLPSSASQPASLPPQQLPQSTPVQPPPQGAPLMPPPMPSAPPALPSVAPPVQQAPSPQQVPNPLLVGNDALRQQFAEHPELAPPNSAQWLNDREQHILGNDAPPTITGTASGPAPAPLPPPQLPPPPPQMPATAPNPPVQAPPPLPAPQQAPQLPQAPQAPAAPPMLPPAPPISAPQLPTPAAITPLPQQAPVMSQVSPAPAVAAKTNVDNHNVAPQQTYTPAYQPPPLPTFLGQGLSPNLGAYKPAPDIPGYAQPHPGTSFMAPHSAAQAPQLPSFTNPFGAPQISGPGGLTAQQTYDQNLFSRLLLPSPLSQF